MIDLVDIKKSINILLKDTGIKTLDNSIKEGFERPSFFVQILPISGTDLLKSDTLKNSYMVEINYFSKEKTQLDNLKMSDILKNKVFPYININERKLVPLNVRATEVEGILSFKFNLNWLDSLEDKKQYPPMEKLEIEME
ncbi:hypothetical protein G8T60_12110 [Clostridium botulinum C]|uniref:phage tail terminator family protein n=1 Tax=Clostridium botulinum TaxID=1491 RepID=UPI001E3882B0|nr:hypothetical protein [Clostridium botulinum]MCD3206774.1 hypothetical protein [Clostridium botulinum C]MCD3209571.1 hypothetical protein [Clostridium botulinum C]MCD3226574.1 hypothetical protein [Clostridium botulinum C]MCD3249007.1 hypothetical protein [Clostridium botulinum C]MCD3257462.1 hypothetical protein [Clostridium botulinum C]